MGRRARRYLHYHHLDSVDQTFWPICLSIDELLRCHGVIVMLRRRITLLGLGALLTIFLTGCWLFNSPPIAEFTVTPATGPAPLTVQYDATATTDPDGDPLTYGWTFGDSTTGSGVSGFHTYSTAGTYTIQLVVTDSRGNATSVSRSVLVTEPENALPNASFNAVPTTGAAPLSVVFNATASNDSDGSIASFLWDFGDGDTATTAIANHTYTSQGAYIVTLTVTDNEGATDTATTAILVTALGNQVPVASFTADPTAGFPTLNVDFDASASTDPDGSIVAYLWDFGDGGTGNGQTVSHAYTSSGTYIAVLTVIDDNGTPASAVETIIVWSWLLPQPPFFPI